MVVYFKDNIYIIKTLKEFQFVDEEGKDQGANVRQKAKDITNLLQDESRLRHERRDRAMMRDRMVGGRGEGGEGGDDDNDDVLCGSRCLAGFATSTSLTGTSLAQDQEAGVFPDPSWVNDRPVPLQPGARAPRAQ